VIRFLAGATGISPLKNNQTDTSPPTLFLNGYWGIFPRLIAHPHLGLRLGMSRHNLHPSVHYYVMYRVNFTSTLQTCITYVMSDPSLPYSDRLHRTVFRSCVLGSGAEIFGYICSTSDYGNIPLVETLYS